MNTRTQTQPRKSTTEGSPSLLSSSSPISAFSLALIELVLSLALTRKAFHIAIPDSVVSLFLRRQHLRNLGLCKDIRRLSFG
ncbi:hypothetical protein RchiOBHm_Chr7g0237891 [Rosa chinensis]|uniref:Uncharacterized protein n=1 Tax=Rosa chinensis TaxID=74649 RepID=A0A2P6PHB3_ROSCH|nr:hypothetical protein RchiOBHm_Chr7g0237891 [Rosa chinensis]